MQGKDCMVKDSAAFSPAWCCSLFLGLVSLWVVAPVLSRDAKVAKYSFSKTKGIKTFR